MSNSPTEGGCRRCCCSFILTAGLTSLFMWLSLRTSNPVCSIQAFYVPALNKIAVNSAANHSVFFDLKLDNENKDKGVLYDAINFTLSYRPPNGSRPIAIANTTFPKFRQGHNKHTHRKPSLETQGMPWEAVRNRSGVVFRVDLATRVRFRIMFWKTKRHSLVVGADVNVSDSGEKVKRKGIRLRSGAPEPRTQSLPLVIGFTFFTLNFII
ncbi:protein NDR1-like isoform X1 [Diospyros lotus]|uniref:protein NDR1-like isoform X1 n=1 Tax=Diospyros lotus TaxID=55363 RepID=UPI00225086E4|nr:protein NDR1-like isoform X1 [Diospyros lotus]